MHFNFFFDWLVDFGGFVLLLFCFEFVVVGWLLFLFVLGFFDTDLRACVEVLML